MSHHRKDVLGFGLFMLLLFVAWVFSGGPENAKKTGDAYNKFQEPLGPIQSGSTYNTVDHTPQSFIAIPE